MTLLDRLRAPAPLKDADPAVRRRAVRGVTDAAVLDAIAREDPDTAVRDAAVRALRALVLEGDEPVAAAALPFLTDPRDRLTAARGAAHAVVARAALERLEEPRALGSVARHGRHTEVRLEALRRLRDAAEIEDVARRSPHEDAALAALERLESAEVLRGVARSARCQAAARRAAALLRTREGGAESPRPATARPTDRAAQTRLCETVEALVRSTAVEDLQDAIAAAQHRWDELIPDVDDDLSERFAAACRVARDRLEANRAARSSRERQDEEQAAYAATHLAPRVALITRIEAAAGATIPSVLDLARWEWHQLPHEPSDECRALEERFDAAGTAAQTRYEAWLQEQDAARQRAERASDARRRRENAARLERLCTGLERLLEQGTLTLKKGERGLRDLRAALHAPESLLPSDGRGRLVRRLKTVLARLSPEIKEMREGDAWKRWANANVQEEVCVQAEALREVADPVQAARRLTELRARWMSASAGPPDRAPALWARFKAAQDEVRARIRDHRQRQAEERAANQGRKEGLCARAEELAASTDWEKTAALLKDLQTEWKTIGPALRGQERALWERFHAACDRFFGQRNAARARQREAWEANLKARHALCEKAESLADSTDWQNTAEGLKKLQADWKTVGPVARRDSETVWQRFRAACDRFFDRYKRREAIDRERHLEARAALCAELEGMAALDPATDGGSRSDDRPARFREIWTRWQQAGTAQEVTHELEDRFDRALEGALRVLPGGAAGADFDIAGNRARLEEICGKIERLAGGSGETAAADLTPAARLAMLWRERLALNTIGGKQAEEARWRAAAGEVVKARAAWQRVGYVPAATRRDLGRRFEIACRRILEEHERFARRTESGPGPRSRGPRERGPRDGARRDRDRGPGRGGGRTPQPRRP